MAPEDKALYFVDIKQRAIHRCAEDGGRQSKLDGAGRSGLRGCRCTAAISSAACRAASSASRSRPAS
jgi:sugar lactone lactonase YvrE